jgi:hypothetical protein
MQLQQLDKKMLIRLSTQFAEFDYTENNKLVIGEDIPSAAQVSEMRQELISNGSLKSISDDSSNIAEFEDSILFSELWKQKIKAKQLARHRNCLEEGSKSDSLNDESYIKLQDLDFTWSKRLWWKAAKDTGFIALGLLLIYLFLGYWVFVVDSKQMNQIEGWYFIAGTLSTVGFGDYAPESQVQRLYTIAMIPFGLIILGFFISFARAYALSIPHKEQKIQDGSIKRIFEQLNIPDDGFITKQQFVDNAKLIAMSTLKAEQVFDKLDSEHKGKIGMQRRMKLSKTLTGKFCFILLKIYGTIAVGAIAFKFWPKEQHLTWVDAFYFTTVTSTSIGYV